MKKFLSQKERSDLDQRIADAEKTTNAQIVLATVRRCDSYAEIPWKAFALGASVAGLIVFLLGFFNKMPESAFSNLLSAVVILAAGAVLALLTVIFHPFARLFLSEHRAETEVRLYAESVFLSREMFKTESRCGILILAGIFEKYAVILPDKGIADRINEEAMNNIIKQISKQLKRRRVYNAMAAGLDGVVGILGKSKAGKVPGKDELPNEVIEEKGI